MSGLSACFRVVKTASGLEHGDLQPKFAYIRPVFLSPVTSVLATIATLLVHLYLGRPGTVSGRLDKNRKIATGRLFLRVSEGGRPLSSGAHAWGSRLCGFPHSSSLSRR